MSGAERLGDLPVFARQEPVPERGDAARNRALLLEAARRLIARSGADAITMDDVAAAAGVGKGTLFRRFGSRAGLMMVLLDEDGEPVSRPSCSARHRWARMLRRWTA
ncbi:TetR family transcriptional regulator [Mycobacterium tuberculosis]|nr:TetR family transcriptional regulator [Mycobacterium tuberculosis]